GAGGGEAAGEAQGAAVADGQAALGQVGVQAGQQVVARGADDPGVGAVEHHVGGGGGDGAGAAQPGGGLEPVGAAGPEGVAGGVVGQVAAERHGAGVDLQGAVVAEVRGDDGGAGAGGLAEGAGVDERPRVEAAGEGGVAADVEDRAGQVVPQSAVDDGEGAGACEGGGAGVVESSAVQGGRRGSIGIVECDAAVGDGAAGAGQGPPVPSKHAAEGGVPQAGERAAREFKRPQGNVAGEVECAPADDGPADVVDAEHLDSSRGGDAEAAGSDD